MRLWFYIEYGREIFMDTPLARTPLFQVGQDPDGPSGWLMKKIMGVKDPGMDYDSETAYRDVFFQTTCDEGVTKLAELLGWTEDLEALINDPKNKTLKL